MAAQVVTNNGDGSFTVIIDPGMYLGESGKIYGTGNVPYDDMQKDPYVGTWFVSDSSSHYFQLTYDSSLKSFYFGISGTSATTITLMLVGSDSDSPISDINISQFSGASSPNIIFDGDFNGLSCNISIISSTPSGGFGDLEISNLHLSGDELKINGVINGNLTLSYIEYDPADSTLNVTLDNVVLTSGSTIFSNVVFDQIFINNSKFNNIGSDSMVMKNIVANSLEIADSTFESGNINFNTINIPNSYIHNLSLNYSDFLFVGGCIPLVLLLCTCLN